jgi:hypothetical protein
MIRSAPEAHPPLAEIYDFRFCEPKTHPPSTRGGQAGGDLRLGRGVPDAHISGAENFLPLHSAFTVLLSHLTFIIQHLTFSSLLSHFFI